MNKDNKDAALELAKELGILKRDLDIPEVTFVESDRLPTYYNAARKPLDGLLMAAQLDVQWLQDKNSQLRQQLLATQEAYQRVADALEHSIAFIGRDAEVPGIRKNAQLALANPPSLEMVERKKLEDEIAVLEEAARWFEENDHIETDANGMESHADLHMHNMIAERKAKLEKMK